MMLQGPTAVSQINELGGDGFESKYATVILPSMNESSGPATSFVGGSNLVTFKDSKNKQSAWKLHPVGKQARGAGRMVQEVLRPARLSEGMG